LYKDTNFMTGGYKKLHWTEHSKIKMRQYGLSVSKLLGILQRPERKEKGICPGTIAVMRTNKIIKKTRSLFKEKDKYWRVGPSNNWQKQKKAPGEIWLMFKDVKIKSVPMRKIISAWRYPGVSKPGEPIPIPDDIREEIFKLV